MKDKPISTQVTPENISAVMALLEQTPEHLRNLSQTLSSTQLTQPLAAGKRSFQQDLAHLGHCEAQTTQTICLALMLPEPTLSVLHPERHWGKLLQLEMLEFHDLLSYFKLRRTVLLRILENLNGPGWARTVHETGKQRQESVYWKARGLALHERHHLEIIQLRLHTL